MELEIGLFVTGFVLGAGLIWILVDKRVTGTIDDMERNYETRIANLTSEVRNADLAVRGWDARGAVAASMTRLS